MEDKMKDFKKSLSVWNNSILRRVKVESLCITLPDNQKAPLKLQIFTSVSKECEQKNYSPSAESFHTME